MYASPASIYLDAPSSTDVTGGTGTNPGASGTYSATVVSSPLDLRKIYQEGGQYKKRGPKVKLLPD